jgi:4-alpha-glucanotransferase
VEKGSILFDKRSGGILLHPSSLPGPHGIGDLGPRAYEFVDWLEAAGCRLWQVLPLGPTGYGNSPYQSRSAFAGNPLLISPDLLVRDGLLKVSELTERPAFDTRARRRVRRVNFGRVIPWKMSLLERAFDRFQSSAPEPLRQEFAAFRADNASWLEDFSLFMAIKEANEDRPWWEWPLPLRHRDAAALRDAREWLGPSITRYSFYQLLFYRQWWQLHDHAHARDIRIIGDLPIFCAADSADVWGHPELFFLEEDGQPTYWAGVPPDYFSATGQLWGNPLYRWENHKRTGFDWWLQRLRSTLGQVDIARLDHFRGFAACWEIPAGSPTAEIGRWEPGPGADLFNAILQDSNQEPDTAVLPLIAEDLGVITPDVVRLRDDFRLPGMRVLQFGFSEPQPLFLPHNYVHHCVAYTGTHDNDTSQGWLRKASAEERAYALRYLQTSATGLSWSMVRAIWSSVAVFAIAPMQDLLGLGTQARMNYPGKPVGNWQWRLREDDISRSLGEKLAELNELYGRH